MQDRVPESPPSVSGSGCNSYSNIIRILTENPTGRQEDGDNNEVMDAADVLGDQSSGDDVNQLSDASTIPSDAITAFMKERMAIMTQQLMEQLQVANVDGQKKKEETKGV